MNNHTAFTSALLDPALPVPEGLLDGFGASAGKRFSVYRNNVTVSLIDALHEGFPAIVKLLGEANFSNVARDYLRAEPPSSPLMMLYGRGFPDYLAACPPLAKFGYLCDVARLEFALRESYHAADATPIAPQDFAQIAPEQLAQVKITLTPSARLITSAWPVFSLWRYNMQDGAEKPIARAESTLITRPEYDPIPHLLPSGGDIFLNAIIAQNSLEEAASQASEKHSNFDLSTILSTLLSSQAISHLSLEDQP
ncbi:putative DNA-binding domain-containing protein [Lentibacter algarum]|uniref:HvfC/BufC N-terminal domain-containing protein n=1 Tax=Lentibacter algarum TaxID=576131 RepID=UPI001C09D3C1|nr:DNA-binding domain-containing protein [Lentibacter algarum]MBU2983212.1 putative DNA-binding domain-containing protein [Lentibacter algarum]